MQIYMQILALKFQINLYKNLLMWQNMAETVKILLISSFMQKIAVDTNYIDFNMIHRKLSFKAHLRQARCSLRCIRPSEASHLAQTSSPCSCKWRRCTGRPATQGCRLVLCSAHPCPEGRYTQSFRFKLVVSYKSCMRPRLIQIQGDSNLFTDFFLR